MAATFRVYSVDLAELLAVPGSDDQELLATIRGQPYFQDEYDERVEEYNEDETPDDPFTLSLVDAAALIVRGEPLDSYPEWVVDFAYEAVCWGLGESLNLGRRSSPGVLKAVDGVFRHARVPLSLSDLVFNGPVLLLPEVDIGFGWWPPERILLGRRALQGANFEGVAGWVAEEITEVRRWLDYAAEHPGDCLIGLYA